VSFGVIFEAIFVFLIKTTPFFAFLRLESRAKEELRLSPRFTSQDNSKAGLFKAHGPEDAKIRKKQIYEAATGNIFLNTQPKRDGRQRISFNLSNRMTHY
jgi:hypothetical protein